MKQGFDKKRLEQKILEFDLYLGNILENDSPKLRLLVIGGASLIISEISSRNVTSDIDVFVMQDDSWDLNSFEIIFGTEIEEEISNSFDINSDVYFFTLKDVINSLNMKLISFESEMLSQVRYLELYTLNVEGIVLTKLLAMAQEDPYREDRDYLDIKDLPNKVDHSLLDIYVEEWKKSFAKKSEIEKFDRAYKRWIENK